MPYELRNVSNPASFGVEWVGESGTVHQLSCARGTAHLLYGRKPVDSSEWVNTMVVDPYRFGMTGAPKTFEAFREIADRFVNPKGGDFVL